MPEISPTDLKEFADKYDLDQLVIVGRKVGDNGKDICTSYGKDREHAAVANEIADYLKYKVMGWKK